MRKLATLILLLFSAVLPMAAQTNTFQFGSIITEQPGPTYCAAIVEWNGNPNAFPGDMGSICFNTIGPNIAFSGQPYASFTFPWQLGFGNNGDLQNQPGFTWGSPVFPNGGTLKTVGATFTVTGSTTDDYGDSVTATVTFTVHATYYHGRISGYYYIPANTGSGSAVAANPPAAFGCCH